MHVEDSQIKDFIIDAGLASRAEIEEAQKEAKSKKRPLGETLVSKGKFSEDDLRRMQAYILGIPFVNLKGQKLNHEILNLIPEPIARKHNIIAFEKRADSLEVEREHWFGAAEENLARAYGPDEPEYGPEQIVEANPDYAP